jgi:hypothetical protein
MVYRCQQVYIWCGDLQFLGDTNAICKSVSGIELWHQQSITRGKYDTSINCPRVSYNCVFFDVLLFTPLLVSFGWGLAIVFVYLQSRFWNKELTMLFLTPLMNYGSIKVKRRVLNRANKVQG